MSASAEARVRGPAVGGEAAGGGVASGPAADGGPAGEGPGARAAGMRRPARHERPDLPARVTIWEVGPRDGLQNEQAIVPAAQKAEFVRRLVAAGLRTVEITSFVRASWVPQLADAEEVASLLRPLLADAESEGEGGENRGAGSGERRGEGTGGGEGHEGVRLPALVPNAAGLARALDAGLRDICVFASATESFARRNLNRSRDEALAVFAPVVADAKSAGLGVRAYVSMCFGDPWEGEVAEGDVVSVCAEMLEMGCDQVSLGDTIGVATTGHVERLLAALGAAGIGTDRLAVHFHDTYGQALANTLRALELGVTTVDSSAGGIGGCPYARSATGNLATEDLCWALDGAGVETGVDLAALVETSAWMAELLGRPSPSKVVQALASSVAPRARRDATEPGGPR